MVRDKVERRNVLWMVVVRLITVTSLLVSAVIIQISVVPASSVAPVYYLVLVAYALTAVYFLLYSLNRSYAAQAYLQTFLDLLLITAFVYTSGGVTSATYALYIFAVIGAGLVISRRAAFLTAGLAAILFGLLVDGLFFGIIPYFRPEHVIDMGLGPLLFIIFTAWSSFFVIAFLVGYLAENLRRTRAALRRAQKELIIKERLAEAGRVSAGLAHEIRNPLAAIAGSVQFLRSELKLGHEQRELMEIVLKESRRVSQAIEQFLDFASPGPRVFTEVNLSETLEETLKILRGSGELGRKYEVTGNYKDADLRYFGSVNQFKQIFWNLVRNAIKAMPNGGMFAADFSRGRREVRLRFADTGKGLSEEDRAHLFEPFYSGFGNGRGLGLATVRRIVDDYEGQIEVRSEPGRGTEITITLPVGRRSETGMEAEPPAAPDGSAS
ncbi:MAG: ATP-binding protein [Candidatus Aminicenantes bacterium]|nr:ATP-binding protein [Candidatus Aminicenantes bacterium]